MLRRVDAGNSYADIAKDHGITRQAVYKRVRALRGKTTKAVVAKKVEAVVDQKLDAVQQLIDINKRANELLKEAEAEKNHHLSVKLMAEIRGQLRLQLEIYQTLYDMKAVAEFQEEVLTAIDEVDSDVRKQIIARLNQKRAVRSAIRFS